MRYGSNGCCTGRDCPEYGHGMFGDLAQWPVKEWRRLAEVE